MFAAIRKGTGSTFGFIGTWKEVSELDNRLWNIFPYKPDSGRWKELKNGLSVKVA